MRPRVEHGGTGGWLCAQLAPPQEALPISQAPSISQGVCPPYRPVPRGQGYHLHTPRARNRGALPSRLSNALMGFHFCFSLEAAPTPKHIESAP